MLKGVTMRSDAYYLPICLAKGSRSGAWMRYSLNEETVEAFKTFISELTMRNVSGKREGE